MSARIFHYPVVSQYDSLRSFADLSLTVDNKQIFVFVDSVSQRESIYIDRLSTSLSSLRSIVPSEISRIFQDNLNFAKEINDDLSLGVIIFGNEEALIVLSGGTVLLDRGKKREVALSAKKWEIKATVGSYSTHDVYLILSHQCFKFLEMPIMRRWVRTLSITDSVLNLQELVTATARSRKKSFGVLLVSVISAVKGENFREFETVMLDGCVVAKKNRKLVGANMNSVMSGKNRETGLNSTHNNRHSKGKKWFCWKMIFALMLLLVAVGVVAWSFVQIRPNTEIESLTTESDFLNLINNIEMIDRDDSKSFSERRAIILRDHDQLIGIAQRGDLDAMTLTWLNQEIIRLESIVNQYRFLVNLETPRLFYDLANTNNDWENISVNYVDPRGLFYDNESGVGSILNFDGLRFRNYQFNLSSIDNAFLFGGQPLINAGENFYLFSDASASSRLENNLEATASSGTLVLSDDQLWIIGSETNTIYRSTISDREIGAQEVWYQGNLGVEVIADAIVVGEQLFLAGNSGEIVKFSDGASQQFVLSSDENGGLPTSQIALFGAPNLERLFAWEKSTGRIFIINKESGEVVRVYQHGDLMRADHFWVVRGGTTTNIYVLIGTRIYLFNI
ncbi:MAG: hypothetical protein LBG64_03115 [Pseudomonadales bacterium]|jgi:hypothetical protein|nr:hypothetical protein [Pseudomonadales bacterium]